MRAVVVFAAEEEQRQAKAEEAQRQEASEKKDVNLWHAAHEPCHASGQALPISEVLSRIDPNGR